MEVALSVEGLTEAYYFEALRSQGFLFGQIEASGSADPRKVVAAARDLASDGRTPWAVLDVDPQAGAVRHRQLVMALSTARKWGINVALSNPCFEFWLWLHHYELPARQPPLPSQVWQQRFWATQCPPQAPKLGSRPLPHSRPGRKNDPALLHYSSTLWHHALRNALELTSPTASGSPEAVLQQNPSTNLAAVITASMPPPGCLSAEKAR